jgi:DNA mismatch repair protein MutS
MPSLTFRSILNDEAPPTTGRAVGAPDLFRDLNLDQIVDAIVADRHEYNLKPLFLHTLATPEAVEYRHEVMRDLQNVSVYDGVTEFAHGMRRMREQRALADKLHSRHQKERLLLDATRAYDLTTARFAERLAEANVRSQGFRALRLYLQSYLASDSVLRRRAEGAALTRKLDDIGYCVVVKDNTVTVRRYEEEPNYSNQVAATFERFREGAARDYLVAIRDSVEMNPVEERILSRVVRLFPDAFSKLADFCEHHSAFADPIIVAFDREVQFYAAYLAYMQAFVDRGLSFCYPQVTEESDATFAREAFDAALARRLLERGIPVVVNDFSLEREERILIVCGPNQGGKTTFARTFGQVHYFASLGLPVPGTAVKCGLFDSIFTHFEREERLENLRSKLEDDLLRIHDILQHATARSVVIINEIFSSTTLSDAYSLGEEIIEKILQLGARCVCVTFLSALASRSGRIVSVVSTVREEDPAVRTYRVVRRPPGGRSYAVAIAEKYGLTYESVKARVPRRNP